MKFDKIYVCVSISLHKGVVRQSQGLVQLDLMLGMCTFPGSRGDHRFISHASWGYSVPYLPSMNHGEVFGRFSTKLCSTQKKKQ
jgi:hypothetical protein